MNKVIKISIATAIALTMSGCMYSNSALQYAEVQNKRVQAGYDTKKDMTASIMKYMAEMNKDCGVRVEMVNGTPVTNVKQCITMYEAMAAVGDVQIQKAEGVQSIADGSANVMKGIATFAVPLGTAFMQYDAQKESTRAQVKITESNNQASIANTASTNSMMGGMITDYTGNFQNNVSTDITKETVTQTTTTDTSTVDTSTTTTDTSTVQPTNYTDGTIQITNP